MHPCQFSFLDFPNFQEILAGRPANFKISNSECSFKKNSDGCPTRYKASTDSCTFSTVIAQLFPDVDIAASTNNFIVPAKFQVKKIESFGCPGNNKNGLVTFVMKSVESVELVTQQLTLGSETSVRISWNVLQQFQPERLSVQLKGFTSIGEYYC